MPRDVRALIALQKKLANKAVLKNSVKHIRTVAGVDMAYAEKKSAAAIVVCDYKSMKVIETKTYVGRVMFPYIPGLLSFRELPAIKRVFAKLKHRPDILLINGNGILHMRYFGIASHAGVVLDVPAIGVVQNLLCGEVKNRYVYYKGRVVGYRYTRRGYAPIYISPGHKVSLRGSISIVKKCMREHKLPEPLYIADRLSKDIARKEKYKLNAHY